jgi:hypothetical protein
MTRRLTVDKQRPQFLAQPQGMTRETIGVLEIESHDAIQIYMQTLLRVQRHDSAVGFQPTEKPLRRVPAPTRFVRACRRDQAGSDLG